MLSNEEILELIMCHAPESGNILEIGYKTCEIAIMLVEKTENFIHGIDHSKRSIMEAQKKSVSLPRTFFNIKRYGSRGTEFFRRLLSPRIFHPNPARDESREILERDMGCISARRSAHHYRLDQRRSGQLVRGIILPRRTWRNALGNRIHAV